MVEPAINSFCVRVASEYRDDFGFGIACYQVHFQESLPDQPQVWRATCRLCVEYCFFLYVFHSKALNYCWCAAPWYRTNSNASSSSSSHNLQSKVSSVNSAGATIVLAEGLRAAAVRHASYTYGYHIPLPILKLCLKLMITASAFIKAEMKLEMRIRGGLCI